MIFGYWAIIKIEDQERGIEQSVRFFEIRGGLKTVNNFFILKVIGENCLLL